MLFLHLILRSAKRVSKDEVAIDPSFETRAAPAPQDEVDAERSQDGCLILKAESLNLSVREEATSCSISSWPAASSA
jgi:hypothetical protein